MSQVATDGTNRAALRIGITCYSTTGGSGIIATEIGLALAGLGHDVHFICHDVPARLKERDAAERITFHRVDVGEYPLPHFDPYTLALAARLAEVSCTQQLDLLHLHYAIPHATSAFLAREILRSQGITPPRTVVTLHGTDITIVGSDPSILATNRFSLLRSDGISVPSAFLKQAARDNLKLHDAPIEVIPNFVDTQRFLPAQSDRFADFLGDTRREKVLIHSSNFRPLKRVGDVVRVLAAVRKELPALLVLIGDGPERPRTEELVHQLGLGDAVRFVGMRLDVLELLQGSDVFLLPSLTEGFGLAALEALACGVPVVASRVGGVPEVVSDGETGLLCESGDVEEMATAVLRILRDSALHARMSRAARRSVEQNFQQAPMVARYEAFYRKVLSDTSSR